LVEAYAIKMILFEKWSVRSSKNQGRHFAHAESNRLGALLLPRPEKHPIVLRDQWRFQNANSTGQRCGAERMINIHHVTPVSSSGINELHNLSTLGDLIMISSINPAGLSRGKFNWLSSPRKYPA
jgi:hypothetical protein